MKTLLLFLFLSRAALAQPHHPAALGAVLDEISRASAEGRAPVALFDLDDTLIDTRERNVRILRDFARTAPPGLDPAAVARVAAVTEPEIRYRLADTLSVLGVADPAVFEALNAFWLRSFFTNEYSAGDVPNAGAVAYASAARAAGALVVYLTGRDVPRMGEGTNANLRRSGFPTGDGTLLLMKPDKGLDDLQFKKDSFARVAALGETIAVFENEPANLNAMAAYFPCAKAVFLDTIHSPAPDVPVPAAEWVGDFTGKN